MPSPSPPHPLRSDLIRRLASSGLVIGIFVAHTIVFRPYITDDAFIAFRYVRNFVEGHGFTYNVGERVWGYTSFLWCALLVPFAWLGLDVPATARLLGVLCNGLLVLVVLTAAPPPGVSSGASRWAALLLATNGAFVLQGLSGLETALFSLLIVLTLRGYGTVLERRDPRRLIWVGALAVLVAMARPEGTLLMLVLLAHLVVRGHAVFGPARWSAVGRYVIGCGPAFAIFLFAMHAYYAGFWPNTINAKVGLSAEQLVRGGHYLRTFVIAYPAHLIVLGIATAAMAVAPARDGMIIATTWALLLFYAVAGGDWMMGYRLYHPAIALSAALLPFCVSRFTAQTRTRHVSLLTSALVVLCAINLLPSWIDPRVQAATRSTYVHRGVEVGKWMHANLPRGTLLATNTAGTVAYYSRLPIVDMMGLTDRVIAGRRDVPPDWKGIEKGDGAYVLSRQPTYIQFASSGGSEEPLFLSDIEIFVNPEFWRQYHRITVDVPRAGRLVLYARRDTPGTAPSADEWLRISEVAARRIRESRFRY